MPQNAASDQGLHCLLFVKLFLNVSAGSKMDLFKVQDKYDKTWLHIRGGIHIIFFLYLNESIYCGYSIEAPR